MKSAYIASRTESDRRARQIAREEVERAKKDFCPKCQARMETQTVSIICKVLHDNFGFDKSKIKELIDCAEAIGLFIHDRGDDYKCTVEWLRDAMGIDLNKGE